MSDGEREREEKRNYYTFYFPLSLSPNPNKISCFENEFSVLGDFAGDLRKLSQRLQLAVEGGEESRQPLLRATVAMTEMQTDLSIPLVEAGQPLDLQLLSAYVHTSTQPEKHGSSMDKFRKLEAENAVLRKMEEHFKKHLTELKRMVIDSRRERDSAKKDVEHLMAELKKNQDHSIVLANALMLPKRKRSQVLRKKEKPPPPIEKNY